MSIVKQVNHSQVAQPAKPSKLAKQSPKQEPKQETLAVKTSRKFNEPQKRITPYAPLAIGSLVASITAKVARKKPQVKILEILAENWREILTSEITANFAEQTRPLKVVYVKSIKPKATERKIQNYPTRSHSTRAQKKATLTIAATKGFAPIAIHQLEQVIAALNTYLGEEVIETIVLKQKSSLD